MAKERTGSPPARNDPAAFAGAELQARIKEFLKAGDEVALRDILLGLNASLSRGALGENNRWVEATMEQLIEKNRAATAKALGELLDDMSLDYGGPLVKAAFKIGGDAPALLPLLGDLVQREKQLLQLRIRATEALIMRSSAAQSGPWIGGEAEAAIRSLNQVVSGLEQGSLRGGREAGAAMVDALRTSKAHLKTEAQRSTFRLIEEALRHLEARPAGAESVQRVLELLKANTPLPVWHPGASTAGSAAAEAPGKERPGDDAALALIIDKGIEVVFSVAGSDWTSGGPVPRRADDPAEIFSPSDSAMLEIALGDPKYPLKLRRLAAALLKVLGGPALWSRLSPRAQFFSDLLLLPYLSDAVPYLLETKEGVAVIDVEEKLPFLLEALEEKSDYVRWVAARSALRAAQDHPEWFHPRHYAKLLPLLTDDHRGVRLRLVQTFQALASFQEREISSVIQGITDSLTEKFTRSGDTAEVRRDLEAALSATLGSLMENVEELQGEVRELDHRRRQLLGYIEEQTMRIGEEIHHEVLNTLCGYLATAIDEEELGEARKWLGELVADLRRIMNRLYPRDLETEGFLATIRKRLEDAGTQVRRRTPEFRVEFDCPADLRDSDILRVLRDPSHIVFLYRIVLEAIINARKHSGGTRLGIRVGRSGPDAFEISIHDNGRGNGGPFEQNVGIPLMLRRAQEIGAEIAFQKASAAGGTAVVIRLSGQSTLPV
jgi:signal transduction histidine kinase